MKEILKVLLVFFLFHSCDKKGDLYKQLLNREINNSKTLLTTEIKTQESFIEFKVDYYPYMEESYDVLKTNRKLISNLISQDTIQVKDSIFIRKFKNQLELVYNQTFDFNCLLIKSNIDKSMFLSIFRNDLLMMKYKLNQRYISLYCNKIE